jgi:hypothetical protein
MLELPSTRALFTPPSKQSLDVDLPELFVLYQVDCSRSIAEEETVEQIRKKLMCSFYLGFPDYSSKALIGPLMMDLAQLSRRVAGPPPRRLGEALDALLRRYESCLIVAADNADRSGHSLAIQFSQQTSRRIQSKHHYLIGILIGNQQNVS